MSSAEYFARYFEIHGELNGKVHRLKRNGEQEIYDYDPVSHYKRTCLTIRNENIRKAASAVSNPHSSEYKHIVRKLYYYTPYILNPGSQEFLAETVFYVREKGSFEFVWQGNDMGMINKIGKRSKLTFNFRSAGTKQLDVYLDGQLYCQRVFVVTENDELDSEYTAWLNEHLEEILLQPEPEFESLKLYRRGMRSKGTWLKTVTGESDGEVFVTRKDLAYKDKKQMPWIYHRRSYDHSVNPQTQFFNSKMPEIAEAWNELSLEEKEYWNNLANGFKYRQTGFNRFTAYRVGRDL